MYRQRLIINFTKSQIFVIIGAEDKPRFNVQCCLTSECSLAYHGEVSQALEEEARQCCYVNLVSS